MTQETELNKYNKPWVVKKSSFNYKTCIDDCDGDWIAQTVINNLSLKGAEAITKHIVKCVNEYDQLCQIKEELIEALEELVNLMQDTIDGEYKPDSFTLQPAQKALKSAKGDR